MSYITIIQYYKVTSRWEPHTLSNKCRRLNIYLMTCSLFGTIRVTWYSGCWENCPSIIMFSWCAAQRILVSLSLSVLERTYQCFFFCSQETVVRIRSSEVWYISLTAIICFKKWYLLSADLSASSLLGLTLWLLFQLVPVADSSSNCQQFFHLSPKWDFSCTFKRRRSSELQCVSVQAAGNAAGRKE